VATGLSPNTQDLSLENTKIKQDKQGFIRINSRLQTAEKNIWALGDCTGGPFLRHLANHEADYLLQTIFEKKHLPLIRYNQIPHAIFTYPQIACAGLTEEALIKSKIPFVIGLCHYDEVARGEAIGSRDSFVKLLFSKKNKSAPWSAYYRRRSCNLVSYSSPLLISKSYGRKDRSNDLYPPNSS
jgi:dihydrolipoamide dehydrogenase